MIEGLCLVVHTIKGLCIVAHGTNHGKTLLSLGSLHRVSSSLSGLVDPSFRAPSGRLEFTVRRQKFKNILSLTDAGRQRHLAHGI